MAKDIKQILDIFKAGGRGFIVRRKAGKIRTNIGSEDIYQMYLYELGPEKVKRLTQEQKEELITRSKKVWSAMVSLGLNDSERDHHWEYNAVSLDSLKDDKNGEEVI